MPPPRHVIQGVIARHLAAQRGQPLPYDEFQGPADATSSSLPAGNPALQVAPARNPPPALLGGGVLPVNESGTGAVMSPEDAAFEEYRDLNFWQNLRGHPLSPLHSLAGLPALRFWGWRPLPEGQVPRDRWEAFRWLADQGFYQPLHTGEPPFVTKSNPLITLLEGWRRGQ